MRGERSMLELLKQELRRDAPAYKWGIVTGLMIAIITIMCAIADMPPA
jgi:hypothetical protein